MECQIFLSIFQKNSAMAILGLKEIEKFFGEGRDKGLPCWQTFMEKWVRRHVIFPPRRSVNGAIKK